MIWTESVVKVRCDDCGTEAEDRILTRRYAMVGFRQAGWSLGVDIHLCPECKEERLKEIAEERAIRKGWQPDEQMA